jgi:hypothetical protein
MVMTSNNENWSNLLAAIVETARQDRLANPATLSHEDAETAKLFFERFPHIPIIPETYRSDKSLADEMHWSIPEVRKVLDRHNVRYIEDHSGTRWYEPEAIQRTARRRHEPQV